MILTEKTLFTSNESISVADLCIKLSQVMQGYDRAMVKIGEVQSGYEWINALILYDKGFGDDRKSK